MSLIFNDALSGNAPMIFRKSDEEFTWSTYGPSVLDPPSSKLIHTQPIGLGFININVSPKLDLAVIPDFDDYDRSTISALSDTSASASAATTPSTNVKIQPEDRIYGRSIGYKKSGDGRISEPKVPGRYQRILAVRKALNPKSASPKNTRGPKPLLLPLHLIAAPPSRRQPQSKSYFTRVGTFVRDIFSFTKTTNNTCTENRHLKPLLLGQRFTGRQAEARGGFLQRFVGWFRKLFGVVPASNGGSEEV